jgi:hypothetical protein
MFEAMAIIRPSPFSIWAVVQGRGDVPLLSSESVDAGETLLLGTDRT